MKNQVCKNSQLLSLTRVSAAARADFGKTGIGGLCGQMRSPRSPHSAARTFAIGPLFGFAPSHGTC
jgi:hypothetical protein